MVSSSLSNYGVYNPNAVDPSATETALATEVGRGNRGDAANLLSTYQILRETNQGNYNEYMRQQHEFAAQQLQQQLYEQNLKALQEGAKTPGLLSLYGSSPVYQQVLGGGSPEVAATIETNLRNMQRAEQFQKGASGMQEATNAGFQPNSEQAAVATAGLAGPQGTPLQIQVANINAAARMAAARLRAAGQLGPSTSIVSEGPFGKEQHNFSGKIPIGEVYRQLDEMGVPRTYAGGSNTNLPPAVAERGPTPGQPARDLQTGPGGTPKTQKPDNEVPGAAELQSNITANIERYNIPQTKQMYDNIKAGMKMNGGKPLVGVGKDGKLHAKGADGQLYGDRG